MLGGDFYHSLFIDQISVYIKIVLIFPENSLKVIYTKPDTNNSYGIILFIIYLAVHKNSDIIIGIDHFIVIHIEGIIFRILKHRVIPDIFRVIPGQDPVKALKIIITPGGRGNKKNGIKAIFFLIGAKIFLQGLDIAVILQASGFPGKIIFQEAVIGHGQGYVYRFCKNCAQLVVNAF